MQPDNLSREKTSCLTKQTGNKRESEKIEERRREKITRQSERREMEEEKSQVVMLSAYET